LLCLFPQRQQPNRDTTITGTIITIITIITITTTKNRYKPMTLVFLDFAIQLREWHRQ
jgi:hypothetical protein